MKTELLSSWQDYRHLFPHIPLQSRFPGLTARTGNRRRRNLMGAINLIRRVLLRGRDLSGERECILDSLPIPVVQLHLVPASTGDWKAYQARYGKAVTKKQTIFGYRLHIFITIRGLILDFELTVANCPDLAAGVELLSEHTDWEVFADKAYISAVQAAELWQHNRIALRTVPRANQKQQVSDEFKKWHSAIRQLIETVNRQLAGQLGIGQSAMRREETQSIISRQLEIEGARGNLASAAKRQAHAFDIRRKRDQNA